PAGQPVTPGQPAQHPASPPAGFAGPQQRPWNAAQEDPAPPWGGESFPPLTPRTSSGWAPTQGPGAFDEPGPPGTGRRIALSALAVVLLAGVGLLVWLLVSGDDPDKGGRAQEPGRMSRISSAPPSPTSSPLPSPPPAKQTPTDNPSALIDLPGETRDGGGEFDRETVVDSKVLPGSFAEALLDTDMGKGLLRTTIVDEEVTIGLYAIEVGDQAEAVSMVEEYGKTQVNGSIPPARELSLQGVPAYASPDDGNSFYRTAYALYDRVIVLDVFGDDPDRVREMFVEIRDEQVAHAPPSTTDF
ncbi:hypothetical protein, partial [Saccharomonospora halophila]|uniref:hypothetical protein n=1 Tax=Saccharomonospora halophila TaxID=129922 RepID=UPI00036A609B